MNATQIGSCEVSMGWRLRSALASTALSLVVATPVHADKVELVESVFTRSGAVDPDFDDTLQVHFIDIGGGDGIMICTPSGKKILIDGGWSWGDRALARKEYHAYIDAFLENDVVDLMIVSHPDYDHFAGLGEVIDTRAVRQIWLNGYDSSDLSQSWRTFLAKVKATDDTVLLSPLTDYMELGSIIRFDDSGSYGIEDDVVITLVNSKQYVWNTAYGNSNRSMNEGQQRNSCSIVVRIDYGETSMLFTGDTNGRGKGSAIDACDDQELFMLRNNDNPKNPLSGMLDCDILKVAHHGSDGSSSLRFLKAVSPEWAVISAGVHHGHPTSGVINRLKHVDVGLDDVHILSTDVDETNSEPASEANLGDDCYLFYIDTAGVVGIEKWNVEIDQ